MLATIVNFVDNGMPLLCDLNADLTDVTLVSDDEAQFHYFRISNVSLIASSEPPRNILKVNFCKFCDFILYRVMI